MQSVPSYPPSKFDGRKVTWAIECEDGSNQTMRAWQLTGRLLRFFHDSISLRFRGTNMSIFATAAQLQSHIKRPADLPSIHASRGTDGQWYCVTGNRRLASLRLASLCKPDCCQSVQDAMGGSSQSKQPPGNLEGSSLDREVSTKFRARQPKACFLMFDLFVSVSCSVQSRKNSSATV